MMEEVFENRKGVENPKNIGSFYQLEKTRKQIFS
jgi:hypothetical protein